MLIHLKNVKPIDSIFYKDTLFIVYNNDYVKKYGRLIVIIKNIYILSLKLINNYLQLVNLLR